MTKYEVRIRMKEHLIELNKDLIVSAHEEYWERYRNRDRPRLGEKCLRVADLLRSHIGYSRKTNDVDMVWSLFRMARSMKFFEQKTGQKYS